MTVRYAAAPGCRALDFADEWVVFNPLSWDAHLLNASAAAVLEILAEQPLDEKQVADFLAEVLTESERPQAAVHACRVLGELAQLGLVRQVHDNQTAL